jgi:hypothetical protein
MSKQIDFFIVGAQKSGTTALDAMLRMHPHVQMAAVKEVHFFDTEHLNWEQPDCEVLHSYFNWAASPKVRGEATPIYLYWPSALARLQRYNPHARLLVGLRHPAFRAYSHWQMETIRGNEVLGFAEAIRTARHRVTDAPGGVHRIFSYVERGFYDKQIASLLQLFSAQQVHFFRTDHLWLQPSREIARIEDFLQLEHALVPSTNYIAPLPPQPGAKLSAADREYLDALFTPSMQCLDDMLDLGFSDWLNEGYQEPMTPSA